MCVFVYVAVYVKVRRDKATGVLSRKVDEATELSEAGNTVKFLSSGLAEFCDAELNAKIRKIARMDIHITTLSMNTGKLALKCSNIIRNSFRPRALATDTGLRGTQQNQRSNRDTRHRHPVTCAFDVAAGGYASINSSIQNPACAPG